MKKLLTGGVFGLYLLTSAMQAGAVTLSLEPSTLTTKTGNRISLDLMIGGLGDYSGDSLGGFDLGILFDSSILTFDGYSLAGYLGDPNGFEAKDYSFGEYASGSVGLTEVSLLSPAELDARQPGSFTLATLDSTVDLLADGDTTFISIDTAWALGDVYGNPLALDTTSDATVSGIPEPISLLLMGIGLICLGFFEKNPTKTFSLDGLST